MSVAGTWNVTLNSPLGDQQAVLKIEDAGGVLSGTLTGKSDPTPLQRLAVDDANISFAADADTPVGRLNLAFTGTVTDTTISGTYATPFGGFNFSATRAA